jgi:ABC-type multidrug transport system fused ATPase/permease subunit
MLIRLLRSHLRPYRRQLIWVVILQALQATAGLYLPRLNARIIDEGVATGDTGFIWRMGGIMLAATLAQISLSRSGATSARTCSTASPTSRPARSPRSAPRR